MSATPGRFADLAPRVASGVVIAALGLGAIWAGGAWFMGFVALAVAIMVWELHGIVAPGTGHAAGVALGALAAVAVALSHLLPVVFVLPLAMLPAAGGIALLPRERRVFAALAALVVLAGFGMIHLREDVGVVWMLWLCAVVVATDILGYFAGKGIGGPKLWPRISPKKTWAGTVAGWAGALIVGLVFMRLTGAGAELLALSVATSMAAQIGDISESAVKRRSGVKDASHLIPGHGGLFDRFDGMFGAAVFLLIVERIVAFPPVPAGAGG